MKKNKYLPDYKQRWYPNLNKEEYRVTSEETCDYNCIAHAADPLAHQKKDYFWWPHEEYHWPEGIPREENLECFIMAYAKYGYEPCENEELEAGYEKVALYVDLDGVPTHAARQLESGKWTSKLGGWEDIEHNTLEAVGGFSGRQARYGKVAKVMKRPRSQGALPL